MALFATPASATLQSRALHWRRYTAPRVWPSPERSESLIHFLGACCLGQETLITLMDSCECVNSLLYVVDPRLSRSTDRLEVDEFLEALDLQKDNITNLRVELNNIDPVGTDYIKLGTFTPFTNLKHLYVEQSSLGNTPRLPRSLETLVVSHCGKPIFDLLDGIVEENNNYIHELKTVNFKPLFSPCTLMLDVQPNFTRRGVYRRKVVRFAREEFELRVGELAEIAEKGRFELIVNCEVYEEYLDLLNEEEEWEDDLDLSEFDERTLDL